MLNSENLTRSECAHRASLVSDVQYQVQLDLTGAVESAVAVTVGSAATFDSTTVVRFDSPTPGADTWIDLIADSVAWIEFNGTRLPISEHWDGARIHLPCLADRNTVEVQAQGRYMATGEGLHRFVDPADSQTYLYTQFEVADARRVYACFEQPDIKASWELSVTAPAHWKVISNSPTPLPKPSGDSGQRWDFPPTPRISTYITAIVAGPYHVVFDSYKGLNGTYPMGLYCRESMAAHLDADEIFEVTKQGFEFYESVFGMGYPFSKYDQLFVPEFNAGAMENAGCVTFLEDYIFRSRVTHAAYETRANTILHELAHMWFGNLVTMRWWDDLWLNESFAEWAAHYASVKATKYTDAWTSFLNQRKAWAYRQDQLPSTHPIAADMVDLEAVRVNFDGITYAKGAAALKQLVAWVGDEHFLLGIRAYFREHAWGNTRLEDLLDALSAASGRDLRQWASQWLETSGVNLIRPELSVGADGSYTRVVLRQELPSVPAGIPETLRDHRLGVGLYRHENGKLLRYRLTELDLTGPSVNISEFDGQPAAELLLLNDGDLTYAKIRMDERSLAVAVSSIGQLVDPMARALIYSATWDMTRDAQMSTGDFLEMVIAGVPNESEVGVVQQLLRQLRLAIDLYAHPSNRDGYSRKLEDASHRWLDAATPGSDHQLAFARGFISVASNQSNLELVAGLLAGTARLPGLPVDAELRWALLKRLVITGEAGPDRIEAELNRDATAAGHRHAREASASIPTAAAKAEAWKSALHDVNIANHALAATIAGIMVAEQRDLLRPHLDEYFDLVPSIAKQRTPEMAQQLIAGLYPVLLVESETIARTRNFLAEHPDLDKAARRMIDESLDAVNRALRCQELDGQR